MSCRGLGYLAASLCAMVVGGFLLALPSLPTIVGGVALCLVGVVLGILASQGMEAAERAPLRVELLEPVRVILDDGFCVVESRG